MKQTRWRVAAVAAGVLALAAAAGGWWVTQRAAVAAPGTGASKAAESPRDKALEFTPAEVTQAQRVTLADGITLSGPLVAPGTAVVRARASGRLLSLQVTEGHRVRAGQVLGTIDQADASSRVAERSALVEAAQTSLAQAERTHAQNERLASQSFISGAALDSSRAAVQTARAQLDAAKAALTTSRVALRDGAVVAPIEGIVARRQVLPGETVSLDQPLFGIVDLSRLELAGTVGTHEVSRLKPGLPVDVRVEGHDAVVTGRIARIAPAAEPGTRAIGVTVELANPQERLRAGQYATATATLSDGVPRWVLPLAAVGTTSGQHHVWTVADGKLQRRAVTLGRRDEANARVEVLDGLPPQATVLAARFDNLRDGAAAVVVAQRAAPMASASASTPTLR